MISYFVQSKKDLDFITVDFQSVIFRIFKIKNFGTLIFLNKQQDSKICLSDSAKFGGVYYFSLGLLVRM